MDPIFVKTPKTLFFGKFFDFLGPPDPTGLSVKDQALTLFLLYDYLTSCRKIKDNPILDLALRTDG